MDESKIILLILIAGNLCVVIAMLYLFLARVDVSWMPQFIEDLFCGLNKLFACGIGL